MGNIQKKAHIISSSSFVLILIFCLLPFVSVRCSGEKIAEATGVELLTGNYSSSSDKSANEKKETNPFMVLVFLSGFAGIIFSIAFKGKGRRYKISVISSAAIITLSLILMQLYISSDVKSQSGQKDDFSSAMASMITINYEIGYWLCLLLPLALIVFMLFIKPPEEQESGRIEEKKKLPVGIIAGIVLGLCAVTAIAIFIRSYNKNPKPVTANEIVTENETPSKPNKYSEPITTKETQPTEKTTTESETSTDFTDPRDNETYKTIKIGNQTWIAQNLNYDVGGSKCYGNDESNCQKYGRLYNWSAATKACPNGWHLPSNSEWDILYRSVDGTSGTESPYKSETAGKYLKAKNGWNEGGNGTDDHGFAALPGGLGNSSGGFSSLGNYGNWWSNTESDGNRAYSRFKSYKHNNAGWESEAKNKLFSVRCLQD